MKTAEQYLDAQLRGPERPTTVTYAEALAAVQAALNDAGTVGQQLTKSLNAFFEDPPPSCRVLPLGFRARPFGEEEPPF